MKSEYRVVGDPKLGNTPEIIKTQCELGEAEHYRDLYRGDSALTNVRVQSRLVPPWIDLQAPPGEREGQVTLSLADAELAATALSKVARAPYCEDQNWAPLLRINEAINRLNSTTHNPEEGDDA